MKKIALIFIAGGMLVFNSCHKTGPQGPQGLQGQTGATGATGPQGNANVQGTNPFNVTNWGYDTSTRAYVASFTDPDITAAVADRGIVEVFLKYSDGTWRNLPDIVNGTQFFSRFSLGGFDIYYSNVDGSTPLAPGNQTFRSVVITPSQKQTHPNTNWKDYNQAIAAINASSSAGSAQQ
jgi:hypothetical protein